MTSRADRRGLLRRATLTRGVLPYTLASYTVAGLPRASLWTGAHVYISDELGGGVEAFSDGVSWRRVTDRAVVSTVTTASLYAVGGASATFEATVGPYLVATGAATGIFVGASFAGAALSAAGVTSATLATPPTETMALSASAAAVGTLSAASRTASGLSATGAATATLVGVAA